MNKLIDISIAKDFCGQRSVQGLRTPRLWGEYGQQGYYRISFLVDETRHLASDSYLTPLAGARTGYRAVAGT